MPHALANPGSRPQKSSNLIALLGWYGSGNAGDEAVLESVVSSLRAGGHTQLIILSTQPHATATRYSVESVPRSPLNRATLLAVCRARALILGGGGLLQDSSSVYNLPLYAFYVALARIRRIPVIGWGLGVGPVYTKLGRLLTQFIWRSSKHFSVRDASARRALISCGVEAESVNVTADSAFLIAPQSLPPTGQSTPRTAFCVRHRLSDAPGLNLRYMLPVSVRHKLGLERATGESENSRFIAAVAEGIRVCCEEFGAEVVLLPFWAERDDEVLRAIEQSAVSLGTPAEKISWVTVEHTPSSLADFISGCDLLVSMRLHALIFGATAGVPEIALSYVPKVRALMRRLGSERWVVEVHTRVPSGEEIAMKLRLLWAAREQESAKLKREAGRLRQLAESDAAAIVKLLNS